MKRSAYHLIFATITTGLLLFILWQAYQLHQNRTLLGTIQNIPDKITEDSIQTNETKSHPAVQLSTASALSAGGQFERAESLLVKLIGHHQAEPSAQAARYNLANHYLRQGLRSDLPGNQTRPLVELAKQRYGDLLLIDPHDWNARYNLEVALRVAPEVTTKSRDKGPPIKSVDVIVPDFKLKDLP